MIEKYIIFWETKEQALPEDVDNKFSLLAVLLKMIECSMSVEMWGRCEGVKKGNEFYYNGFILFSSDCETLSEFLKRYEKYITITGTHRYISLAETQRFMYEWKQYKKTCKA